LKRVPYHREPISNPVTLLLLCRFLFIIYLTLNLMAFYGIMGVYVTPSLVVASVLSGFFYGAAMPYKPWF
jgi:hypothetical protein